MNIIKNTVGKLIVVIAFVAVIACEQESFEPLLTTEDGAGTLTSFKAYTLDSMVSVADSAYGRVVFWLALDGTTLIQLSLYNVPEDVSFPSAIMNGSMESITAGTQMSLYNVENTGEGYGFGEFATSKYYVIDDPGFYSSIDEMDAHVAVTRSTTDPTIICAGNIGINEDPVEEN